MGREWEPPREETSGGPHQDGCRDTEEGLDWWLAALTTQRLLRRCAKARALGVFFLIIYFI